MLSPNGGETWQVGSARAFVWTSDCYTGNVRIDVSKSGPAGPWTTLLPSTPSDGQEMWLVRPEDAGWTHARVVAVPSGPPTDASDAAFSAVSASTPNETPLRIAFSTANAAPAPGHAADGGLPFDATRGFGWSQAVTTVQRDMLPNDCRDSFAQVINNTTATWEM